MRIIFKIFIIITILLLGIYGFLIYGIPKLAGSDYVTKALKNYVEGKTALEVDYSGLQLSVNPLIIYNLKVETFNINKSSKNILNLKGLNLIFDLKTLKLKDCNIQKVYVNGNSIGQLTSDKHKKKKNFNPQKLPEKFRIDELFLSLKDFDINATNLSGSKNNFTFDAGVYVPFINEKIYANNVNLSVLNNKIIVNNLVSLIGKSYIDIKGTLKKDNIDLKIIGHDIPVNDIEKTLLYIQKKQDPSKKFIENFKNYSGLANVNLRINKDGFFGDCIMKNLHADSVLFDVPITFPNAVFKFDKRNVTSYAKGTLGNEAVVHELKISNLGTGDNDVFGKVYSTLTKDFHYVPNLTIKDKTFAKVCYRVKNHKITVDYLLNIAPNADIFYKDIYLGLNDKNRKFKVTTFKDGDKIYVKNYSYLIADKNSEKSIIDGDGLFEKRKGKYKPLFFNCKTNGYAPVSVIGSFGRYIYGGEFNGNLKFDLENEKIYGDFEVIDTHFNAFHVKSAKVIARDNIKIIADGLFHRQKFNCNLEAKNQFGDDVYISNLDLFLDKFIIKKSASKSHKTRHIDISSKIRKLNITVQNWDIKVNSIIKDRLVLENILLYGNMKNNIFSFVMKDLVFAKGILKADGKYDFNDDSSCINFKAYNINSNHAADVIFNLPNQIEGTANAKLHVDTKNKLEDIKADAEFSVTDGYLPQLGNTKLMFKKFRKGNPFKISDLTNIDFSMKDNLSANINGSFKLNNDVLEDINITTRQKFFASYINGKYNMVEQNADFNIFGKYDKDAPKGYKILFMPLNWILEFLFRNDEHKYLYHEEIQRIPSIFSKKNNEKFFRIKIDGNLNTEQLNIDIKGLKK